MSRWRDVLAAAILSFGAPAFADAALRTQSIPEGARMDIAPMSLTLQFVRNVELTNAILIDQEGNMTELVQSGLRGSTIQIPLPALVPHGYRLHWRATDRGAATTGSVGFLINGCDDLRPVQ